MGLNIRHAEETLQECLHHPLLGQRLEKKRLKKEKEIDKNQETPDQEKRERRQWGQQNN
jgi:hypothetical protein